MNGTRRWMPGLPAPLEGVLWMAGAAVCWALNTILIRPISLELPPIELLFLRCLFAALLFIPFIGKVGLKGMKMGRPRLYFMRASVMFVSMLMWIYAVKLLPIAEAVSLGFTAPLFATVLAATILHEKVGIRRWTAVFFGFVGALVIIRPGVAVFDPAALYVLINAATWASAIILSRMMSRTESPTVIVGYMFIMLTPATLIPTLFVWQTPSWTALVLVFTLASTGTLGHIAVSRALTVAETSVVVPLEYLQLPLAAFASYLLFGEIPDEWTPVGAAIIIASVLYIAHREAVRARAASKLVSEPVRPPEA
ncbi:MAG: DMT family transporter [Alphaproteobacteria bacterium]